MMEEFRQDVSKVPCVDSIDLRTVWAVCDWSRQFCKIASPSRPDERFGIGVYQIRQALAWAGRRRSLNYGVYESISAGVLHFVGAAELLGVRMDQYLPATWYDLPNSLAGINWTRLLLSISAAQQCYCYWYLAGQGSVRRARLDLDKLGRETATIVTQLMQLLPPSRRHIGFESAMQVAYDVGVRRMV
ncbi:MAG: hypothetical protein WC992_07080 [Acholeplasmataceae bacterium]|jgi:hypothetical protein